MILFLVTPCLVVAIQPCMLWTAKLIQKQLFLKRCFLKFCKTHVKTFLLESLFNNVAGLNAWNFIKKDSGTGIFQWILQFFKKPYLEPHLRMTATTYSSVPTKVLSIDHFFCFFLHFFLLSLIITIMAIYSESI